MTFAWTTPALLAGAKTVARQPWSDRKAAQFRAGTLATAYGRVPQSGGRPVAAVRLTHDPVREPLSAMPDSAYDEEGWRWLHAHRDRLPRYVTDTDFSWEAFERWRARPGHVWVVRFRLEAIAADQLAGALALAAA